MTSRCVFRVAAGPRIGFGHLMRARALAECLPMPAVFSVRGGGTARQAARDLGCEVVEVRLKPDTTDDGTADHGWIRLRASDFLVVDDPRRACGRPWIDAARRAGAASLSVHDDRATLPADLVVRGSIDATAIRAAGRELVGPSFYVLSQRVLAARLTRAARTHQSNSSSPAPTIVIALGGGQHVRSAAQPIVTAIQQRLPRARIAVAPGFTSGAGHRLPALVGARWLRPSPRLVDALVDADVAIVAGGVTLYEACAIGVPTIACAVVPAQRRAIRAFARQGAIVDAGDAGSIVASRVHQAKVAAAVAALINGGGRQAAALSRRARTLVDGRGAERVSKQLLAGGRRG